MGCFLLVMEEGGLWGSKHPKPLSPSDTTAVPEAQAAVASLSCGGAALDLGDCLGARVFFFLQESLAWLGGGSTAVPLIQPVPGWFGVFGVPLELRGEPQLLVLSTAGTCEVLTRLLIA